MTALQRALLVGPYPAYTWKSIANYSDAIASMSGLEGVELAVRHASWWMPPVAGRAVDARRGRAPLTARDALGSQLVHITDQGLGHHVGRFEGIPTVVTCHDVMPFVLPEYYRGVRGAPLRRLILQPCMRGLRRADHVVAVSERTAGDIVAALGVPRERISVIGVPISASLQPVEGADRALAGRGIDLPRAPRILSIGTVAPYKNLDLLLAALARPALAGATIIRVGQRLTPRQKELASRLGVAARVFELGNIDADTLLNIYSACDVLAQPSLYEGFGMPVVEAMACGLPVVASDGGSLPEVCGDAAVVVPLGTNRREARDRFADALASVLASEPERASLRTRGLARAEAFRPRPIVTQLLALYRDILERRRT